MIILKEICLSGVLIAAVYDDYKRYKIDNRIILISLFVGFILLAIEFIELFFANSGQNIIGKYVMNYLLGMFLPFVILFPVFIIRGIGAGDIKVLCIIGFFLGYSFIIRLLTYIIPVALIMCIFILAKDRNKQKSKLHKMHFSYVIAVSWAFMVILKYWR